jgi:hypothetical protein
MKKRAKQNEMTISSAKKQNRCLSCGTTKDMKNHRYCSIKCRQKLRQKLNLRSGFLQALNVRYATFYFSDTMIIMDVILHGVREIFQFTHSRVSGHKPGDDFSKMTDSLGNAWWAEEKRTNRKYLASRHVLGLATRQAVSLLSMRPRLVTIPTIGEKSLARLAIDKSQLASAELRKIIKNAYRQQAKIHHPDAGGSAVTFRQIHDAYKELLHWAENPKFIRRRGFPDKWFYDGDNKKWVQPMPVHE